MISSKNKLQTELTLYKILLSWLVTVCSSVLFLTIVDVFPGSDSHGRLMEPPNRSSLWRFPEFDSQNPPKNYNDNELFCGGKQVQHEQNGGMCGECGDPYHYPKPRDNEGGGMYAKGIITRRYTTAQVINVAVELTAAHSGYFEFRLCPQNNVTVPEQQDCFDNFLMEMADGSGTQFPVSYEKGFYNTSIKLPHGVTCSQCVLQWHYRTGNTWGECGNGTNALSCGPQETFRGCADVSIS